jgi:hypothetical protein
MGGNLFSSQTTVFSDWKFNEDVDKPPPPKPAETGEGGGN